MANEGRRTGLYAQQLSNLPPITYDGREAQVFKFDRHDDGSAYVKIIIEQYLHVHLSGYFDENGELIAEDEERETFTR